jgi:hypothetical protein
MNIKQMIIKNYGKFYGNQEHILVDKNRQLYRKMVHHQENVKETQSFPI